MSSTTSNGRRDSDARLLVVEDEPNILELLAASLRYSGFEVITAAAGNEAVQAAQRHRPDLIVLDVMLPDMDGFDVVRRLRGGGAQIPVVFLTARDSTEDKIRGLTLGGDDYVTKPFSLEEVIARIRAVLRRTRGDGSEPPPRLKFADLELDEDSHEVWRDGKQVQLSPTEFKLLRYFMGNANRVLSKMQILDHVWDYDFRGDTGIVESYVSVLRRKIDTSEPHLLHTLRGVGYVLRLPGVLRAFLVMAYNTRPAGFWEALRRLPERTPLRTKLITAVLALVAVALLVMSVAGLSFLHTYLLGTADAQLSNLEPASPGSMNQSSRGTQLGPESFVRYFLINGKTSNALALNVTLSPGSGGGPQITPGASWLRSGAAVTVSAQSGGGSWRVQAVPNVQLPNGTPGTLVVGVDVTSQYSTIGKLTTVDVLVSVLILIALVALGAWIIQASLRPLTEIEGTAGAIAAGDLTRRVPERDPRTEVGLLGRSLNVMLSQIETAFDASSRSEEAARRSEGRMRQFVADASHELRTPLTAIRGFAEYYRQRGGVQTAADSSSAAHSGEATPQRDDRLAPADLDRIMRRVEQESARMGVLVEDMLLLARLDQQRPLDSSTVDLLTLAADAVHDARVVAPSRNINLTVGAGAALLVNGDEVRLRQVIGNLMSNALAHTPDGTPIDVRIRSGSLAEIRAATASAGPTSPDAATAAAGTADTASAGPAALPAGAQSAAVLEVTDHGPGLSEDQAAHAFERFYRADAARTTGGTGLGLAIVAALVTAHGGAVWVRTQPGHGATFAIALPLTPEAVREAGQGDEHDETAAVDDVIGDAPEADWIDSPTGRAAP